MQDQRWHIELFQVLRLVRFRECLDAFVGVLETGLHAPEPKLLQDALRDVGTRPVGPIKKHCQVLVEQLPGYPDGVAYPHGLSVPVRLLPGHRESPCLLWDWHTASFPVVGSMDGTSKPTSVNRRPVHVRLERGNLIFRDTGSFT